MNHVGISESNTGDTSWMVRRLSADNIAATAPASSICAFAMFILSRVSTRASLRDAADYSHCLEIWDQIELRAARPRALIGQDGDAQVLDRGSDRLVHRHVVVRYATRLV